MDDVFQAPRSYGRRHSTRLAEIARQLVTLTLDPRVVLTASERTEIG